MANNNFLPFAGGAGANVLSQADYAALTSVLNNGFTAGTAQSAQLNKVWRQSSIISAVIGQLIANRSGNDAIDDGTTATLLANLEKAIGALSQIGGAVYALDTGTANAYAAAYTPAITALTDGMVLKFKAKTANNGSSTFAPNGLAAKPIVGGAHAALQGGEIVATGDVWLQYNSSIGTGSWILVDGTGGAVQVAPAAKSQQAVTLGQLQNAMGNLQAFIAVSANTTLTASQAGSFVVSNGGTGYVTVALPLVSSVAAGSVFIISHISGSMTSFGVSTSGSDPLVFLDFATSLSPYAMSSGETLFIVSTGNAWKIFARTDGFMTGRLVNVQVFNTPGSSTYTSYPGTKSVVVELCGGGGGGGGAPATAAGSVSLGAGGGAGAYAKKRITSGFSGVTVTVGAGGAASAGGNGGAGGSSSFGALVSAGGGAGGGIAGPSGSNFVAQPGGGSSTTSGADISNSGGTGSVGIAVYAATPLIAGGNGGSSTFGAGGNGASNAAGGAASAKGAGGGGASVAQSGSALAGGAGSPGVVIVWEYA